MPGQGNAFTGRVEDYAGRAFVAGIGYLAGIEPGVASEALNASK